MRPGAKGPLAGDFFVPDEVFARSETKVARGLQLKPAKRRLPDERKETRPGGEIRPGFSPAWRAGRGREALT